MVNLFRFKPLRVAKSQNYETGRRQVCVFLILFGLLVIVFSKTTPQISVRMICVTSG